MSHFPLTLIDPAAQLLDAKATSQKEKGVIGERPAYRSSDLYGVKFLLSTASKQQTAIKILQN